MKTCRACNKELDYSNFHKAHNFKDGYASRCVKCLKELARTKQGVINCIYGAQRSNSRQRGYALPSYTNKELSEWCLNQPIFHELYNAWVNSGYLRKLKPSCDRLDDYKPYELSNIQLVAFKDNENKGHKDRVQGINNKASHAVKAYDLEDNFVAEYHSTSEAARQIGIDRAGIREVVRYAAGLTDKPRYTAGGLKWKYA